MRATCPRGVRSENFYSFVFNIFLAARLRVHTRPGSRNTPEDLYTQLQQDGGALWAAWRATTHSRAERRLQPGLLLRGFMLGPCNLQIGVP